MTYAICLNPLCPEASPDGQPFTITVESDVLGNYCDDLRCPECGEEGRFQ